MSQVVQAVKQKSFCKSATWRYSAAGSRDLRIDFMRGIALVMMVVAHTEIMSLFNIFTGRFGLVTGAEGFVILSGFMLGMLSRARLQKVVWLTVSWGLYLRAWKIYRVNILIILSFLLLGYLPFINVFEVTHFTDRFSGTHWSLYPVTPQIKETWFNIVFYLQIGPHQTQILGLYMALLNKWILCCGTMKTVVSDNIKSMHYMLAYDGVLSGISVFYQNSADKTE